jgi:hypothetical protein
MPLSVAQLDTENYPEVLSFLRRSPYRNAITLAQITHLRTHSFTLAAFSNDTVVGVVSIRRDLPLIRLAFTVDFPAALPPLLHALITGEPELQRHTFGMIVPTASLPSLNRMVKVENAQLLYQMVAEPETFRPVDKVVAQRLPGDVAHDLTPLRAITAAWQAWHLAYGPAFGIRAENGQIMAAAATCLATRDVVEIGWAMQPAQLSALQDCISSLTGICFGLAPRVYLFAETTDDDIILCCRTLGFWAAERFVWVLARLCLS